MARVETVVCDACGAKDIEQGAFGPIEYKDARDGLRYGFDLCHDCVRDLLQDVLYFSPGVYDRFENRIEFIRKR